MNSEELNKLMTQCADDAISTTLHEFQIELDNSLDSIVRVDDILLSFIDKYKDQALEDKAVFTLCNIYGAYVGEVFKRHIGGSWHYDDSDPDAPYTVLEYNDKSYAFAGVCYQRLVNDSQISVKDYFDKAVENNVQ